MPQVRLHPHFNRRVRRAQALCLYGRLLRSSGRIFVPTAGANDLSLLGLATLGGRVKPGKASMFFHWFRPSTVKRVGLGIVARRQPDLRVMGPTPQIVGILRDIGFRNVRQVPYPVSTKARPPVGPPVFRHLLFAGAARLDKGFDKVVDLVALLKRQNEDIPVAVQTSSKHYGKRDPAIDRETGRLEALRYRGLQVYPRTLDSASYLERFHGGVCLQPYVRHEFAGRVSAVTVEALASGAPIIATAGTWMGDAVQATGAGVAVDDVSAEALREAAHRVIDDYEGYSANARKAAALMQEEHSGAHLLRAVLEDEPETRS
jgi:glycosyltransferase involved in cell wall biosynthesis